MLRFVNKINMHKKYAKITCTKCIQISLYMVVGPNNKS
jgi:hypothetical protein